MIARFLLEKAMDKADAVWDERGYTTETMQSAIILNIEEFKQFSNARK